MSSASPQPDIYLELMSVVVKRFITLLGQPGLILARRVYGLRVDDDGTVSQYRGEGMVVLQSLIIEYMDLLGSEVVPMSNRAIQHIIQENPQVLLPSLLRRQ